MKLQRENSLADYQQKVMQQMLLFSMHSYKLRFNFIFQLETDVNIISRKAREALQKYNHQVRSFFMMKFNL